MMQNLGVVKVNKLRHKTKFLESLNQCMAHQVLVPLSECMDSSEKLVVNNQLFEEPKVRREMMRIMLG